MSSTTITTFTSVTVAGPTPNTTVLVQGAVKPRVKVLSIRIKLSIGSASGLGASINRLIVSALSDPSFNFNLSVNSPVNGLGGYPQSKVPEVYLDKMQISQVPGGSLSTQTPFDYDLNLATQNSTFLNQAGLLPTLRIFNTSLGQDAIISGSVFTDWNEFD
jgi:hypothetical protein